MVLRSTEQQPRVGIPRLWADADKTGVALLALRFISPGLLDLAFESPQAAARGSLPRQKLAGVVVYIDPGVRLFIGLPSLVPRRRSRSLSRRSAWPCESVDWIQSYYPILTFRGLCLHGSPQTGIPLRTPTPAPKQHKNPRTPACCSFGTKIFSYFLPPRCS